jgi:hypothetical protein
MVNYALKFCTMGMRDTSYRGATSSQRQGSCKSKGWSGSFVVYFDESLPMYFFSVDLHVYLGEGQENIRKNCGTYTRVRSMRYRHPMFVTP